jgi:hypothetical protein
MKGSCYARFCEGKLPKKFQKRAEGFASVADTVQEEMFRAGFYCGNHLDEINPKDKKGFEGKALGMVDEAKSIIKSLVMTRKYFLNMKRKK